MFKVPNSDGRFRSCCIDSLTDYVVELFTKNP
jgi:hypothetical protein